MKLKNKRGKFIKVNDISSINTKIEILKQVFKNNPTKEIKEKFQSLLTSETFFTMLTEGEASSRRQIKRDFERQSYNQELTLESFKDFANAFLFVLEKREINIANVFALYSIISENRIDKKNKLENEKMFRQDKVIISGVKLGKNYEGFDPNDISDALNKLFDFIKNSNYNIYFRAIVGHIYFELIHPFYDFNGRTGRFLPLWIFVNEGRADEMMCFATAMGHFKDQYLSIFKYVDSNTYEVNLDRMIHKILNLLILNQKQYIWIKKLENKFLDLTKKNFSLIQKNLIWKLMIKAEISVSENSWFKINKDDKQFIELKMTPSAFSNAIKDLRENKIIEVSKTSPRRYKLNGYQLFGLN